MCYNWENIMNEIITHFIALLFGCYLGFIFDRKILKKQEFYRASKELRDAFIPALVELDPIDDIKEGGYTQDTFSFNIVKKYFDLQKKAVFTFAKYLGKEEDNFMKDWEEYAYPYKDLSFEVPDLSLNKIPNQEYFTLDPADEPKIREKLRTRINKILSYAKFK